MSPTTMSAPYSEGGVKSANDETSVITINSAPYDFLISFISPKKLGF